MRSSVIAALLTLATPVVVVAWGGLGHRTVGYLAEKHLTDEAKSLFDTLLANDQGFDYSDAAVWADAIKQRMPWTRPLHFINPVNDNPPKKCDVVWPTDCPDEGCVVSATFNYTSILLNTDSDLEDRKNATMFVMHLIGDIHQPLHASGWERGGNDFKPICWKHSPPSGDDHCTGSINLHEIWDKHILHKLRGLPISLDKSREKAAAAQWADDLFGRQQAAAIYASSECTRLNNEKCILQWTTASNKLVCSNVLKRGLKWMAENDLSEEYFDDNWEVVDDQIGKAGLRLGAWMNAIAAATSGRNRDL
ncbi:S1/P1 nuclease [Echria macrotheca]|uniref:S1/P1 nuclease n=1 Tax=Echria macrotheca TaxID=438768 RepID=A0AAJ0BFI0_9PEZI|nr:S1/P1 nuclease [Echria macrotheca]